MTDSHRLGDSVALYVGVGKLGHCRLPHRAQREHETLGYGADTAARDNASQIL